MRAFLFGDIHGNEYALEACLRQIDDLKADEVYCLGDLVGWLPFGNRTLARMRTLDVPTVAGNHDLLVGGLFTDHPGQLDRMQATAYNAGLLAAMPGAADYLVNLPLMLEDEDFVVVHHSPFHLPRPGEAPTIECFGYLDEAALAGCLEAWQNFPQRIIISGHDHLPAVYELPDDVESPQTGDLHVHRPTRERQLTVTLNPRSRYWVKAGSVGGPYRDGFPVANSVLFDSDAQTITLFRTTYEAHRLHHELASHLFMRNLATIKNYIKLIDA
jgi:predicted phosphodiesterase